MARDRASLARRDWGETVDDMAQNFGYQFAGNLQKYAGRWNEMPVDSHMLNLRQKLEKDPANPVHFVTVHHVGYKFVP